MDISIIPIGTRFDLELINNIGERIGKAYVSQLLDIIDAKNLVISCPIHESRLTFIATGTRVRIAFLHDKYGLLSFTGTITEKVKSENILSLHTRVESELEKIQRRKHFRLDCYLDAKFHLFPNDFSGKDSGEDKENRTYKKVLVKNISGSGACMVTEEDIAAGGLIELIVYLDRNTSVKSLSKVIRSTRIEKSKDKKYEIGLYFKEITPKDQDMIIKYIFKQQSQLLKNNVLGK